jgi:hypothetical protein
MWPDSVAPEFMNTLEAGHHVLQDEKGQSISEGNFKDGFRTGQWLYHPTAGKSVTVDWTIYTGDGDSTKINYPAEWTVHESAGRPFQATFPLMTNENETGKYFIVQVQNEDSTGLDLNAYQDYYKSQAFKTETVKEYSHFIFETKSGKYFYFLRYIMEREGEEILVLALLGKVPSGICDVTYSSVNTDYEKKHIIFFDMVRSLIIEKERFFSPLDPVRELKRLEYTNDKPTEAS